jgi:THO complex subunit 2
MKPWLDMTRACLLPALAVSSVSAGFDVELWLLLKHFPYAVRFGLYGEFRDFTCGSTAKACPVARQAALDAARDVKRALTRVTAASSSAAGGAPLQDRGPARALAKISHSNPVALWSIIVSQVKSYPNIGTSIVEAGRYLTQMSMDVAMFSLTDALTEEPKLNDNGTDVVGWLMSRSIPVVLYSN